MSRRVYWYSFILILAILYGGGPVRKAASQSAPEQYFVFSDRSRTFRISLSTRQMDLLIDASSPWQFTPDGQAVVMAFHSNVLTIVPLAGGPTRDVGSNVAAEYYQGYTFNADGSYIVYKDGDSGLHSVAFSGGEPASLTASGTSVYFYSITPDGKTVIYLGEAQRRLGLYAVPISGGTPTAITDRSIVKFNTINDLDFLTTPDGSHLVFAGQKREDEKWGIFSVPVTGGTLTQLNTGDVLVKPGATSGGCCVDLVSYALTPDGSSVIYQGADSLSYLVPLAGGTAAIQLPYNIVLVSPNHDKMLVSDGSGAWSVMPAGGGAAVPLNLPTDQNFKFTPDGQYIVASTDSALFAFSTADGTSQQISPAGVKKILGSMAAASDYGIAISPDSQRVVYFAEDIDGPELFSTPITGGESAILNQVPGTSRSPMNLWISADSTQVVFMFDQAQLAQKDLYLVPIGGGENTWLTQHGEANTYQFSGALSPQVKPSAGGSVPAAPESAYQPGETVVIPQGNSFALQLYSAAGQTNLVSTYCSYGVQATVVQTVTAPDGSPWIEIQCDGGQGWVPESVLVP